MTLAMSSMYSCSMRNLRSACPVAGSIWEASGILGLSMVIASATLPTPTRTTANSSLPGGRSHIRTDPATPAN